MGSDVSKQRMGERVRDGRSKLKDELKLRDERVDLMMAASPETMQVAVDGIMESLSLCSPFLDGTLLVAFKADPETVEEQIMRTTEKVLTAPIKKEEWQWFQQFMLSSTVWFLHTADGDQFMYQKLMEIAKAKSQGISAEMDSIYQHLQSHKDWDKMMSIKNQTFVARQDDEEVGLLGEDGILSAADMKEDGDDDAESQKLKEFVESNVAVNMLTATAKKIDSEFQGVMKQMMSRYGEYKPGPIKKVERCVSKLENDYQDAAFPKAAKLLDLVRGSVAFNTVSQLLEGYEGFMEDIERNSSPLQVARVKNGFLESADGGYRDIKINVIFQSQTEPDVRMICEVQLMLNQYMFEKKKMHKLYSVTRDEMFYKMVVQTDDELNMAKSDEMKAFQFAPILKLKDTSLPSDIEFGDYMKCAMNSELGLMCLEPVEDDEDIDGVFVMDINTREVIFETQKYPKGFHCHHWLTIGGSPYLSVQSDENEISFFKVGSGSKRFSEDENMKITVDEDISYVEFDKNGKNVFFLRNGEILEKRKLYGDYGVVLSMELECQVSEMADTPVRQVAISHDGRWCAIGGGADNPSWYLVDLVKQTQTEFTSPTLPETNGPCLINGVADQVAIAGGYTDNVIQIWDVINKEVVRELNVGEDVRCTYSLDSIFAVGTYGDRTLRVFNTDSWDLMFSLRLQTKPQSLHLTSDLKYLTVAGEGGELCILLKNQSAE